MRRMSLRHHIRGNVGGWPPLHSCSERAWICGSRMGPHDHCELSVLEAYLDGLWRCISTFLTRPALALGDFNTHSTQWGDRLDNVRGDTLIEWAAALNFDIVNRGSVSTCVRWQGESIADLKWANPLATTR